MNRLQVIGKVTKDAEVVDVSGRKAINFCVAHNKKIKSADGQKIEKTTFYNCTIWREENVNVAHYLTKGTNVFVEGTPEAEAYMSKEGELKKSIKIIVADVELLSGGTRNDGGQSNGNNNTSSGNHPHHSSIDSDLPF